MKTFLVTSSGTFLAIVEADRSSRSFESARNPANQYKDRASSDLAALKENETAFQRFKNWGRENRYPIVTASWVASLGIALGLVGRNPYLTRAQKLVQARVYAQGLTLAILIATAAFEVGDASKVGFQYLIGFTAILSLNLAVLNLVPFPALDGGRILIIFVESILRRRLNPKVINAINGIGFIVLIGLMLLVTFNDITKLL